MRIATRYHFQKVLNLQFTTVLCITLLFSKFRMEWLCSNYIISVCKKVINKNVTVKVAKQKILKIKNTVMFLLVVNRAVRFYRYHIDIIRYFRYFR